MTTPGAPSVAPATTPFVTGPARLVEMLTPRDVTRLRPGMTRVASDGTGTTARVVARSGRFVLEVRGESGVLRAVLPDDPETPFLLDVQLDLGQAGPGWVVGHEGGDSTRFLVYVEGAGRLVRATPVAGDPDFGGGFTETGGQRLTWFTDADMPYTRVATGRPDQFTLYRWDVGGRGEGGGEDDLQPRLLAVGIGTICLDEAARPQTVARC